MRLSKTATLLALLLSLPGVNAMASSAMPRASGPAQVQGGPNTDLRWAGGFGLAGGCDGQVHAITAAPDGSLILGGDFSLCGDVQVNRIARFEPISGTWSALGAAGGEGLDGSVRALAYVGNDLYVGGGFSNANVGAAVSARRLARWNGSTWSGVGNGGGEGIAVGIVNALAVEAGVLYVAGSFTEVNTGAPVAANNVARWNGSSWQSLDGSGGQGVDGPVLAMAVGAGQVYVGGSFANANVGATLTASRLASWNGSAWSAIGSGGGEGANNTVMAMAHINGELLIGGLFTGVNVGANIAASRVARWNGSTWSVLGSSSLRQGLNGAARSFHQIGSNLYVGGDFTVANLGSGAGAPVSVQRIARWDGSLWQVVGSGAGNGTNSGIRGLTSIGTTLYAAGVFTEANAGDPITANRFAQWDGSAWSAGSGGGGINGTVNVVLAAPDGIYVGGSFSAAGDTAAGNVARWDGTTWHRLGSGNGNGTTGPVHALAWYQGELYVGGDFTTVAGGSLPASRLARWNGSNWSTVSTADGNGTNLMVRALAVWNGLLCAGGDFASVNLGAPIAANRVACWNGSAWTTLGSGGGNGVNGSTVHALAVHGSNLVVAGRFFEANLGGNTVSTSNIARWTGSAWQAIGAGGGNGLDDRVRALAVDGGTLYAGGDFANANVGNGLPAARLARWTGSSWQAIGAGAGNGVDATVHALAVSDGYLYAGGEFTQANIGQPINASRVLRFRAGNFSVLGSGLDASVLALAVPDSDSLFVGGSFLAAGGRVSSRIARYSMRGSLAVQFSSDGGGQVTSMPAGINCSDDCEARFAWDQPVMLQASPDATSAFAGWSGAGCSGSFGCTINLQADSVVQASFDDLFHAVGGTISGLAGTGLVLRNNGVDDLAISSADDTFVFPVELANSSPYQVSIVSQPSAPDQTCSLENEAGVINGADVLNVVVDCVTDRYLVTPSVSAGGSITPAAAQSVAWGETTTFTLVPAPGFRVDSVGGSCGGTLDGLQFTTQPVVDDCTVQANFVARTPVVVVVQAEREFTRVNLPVAFSVTVSGTGSAPSDGSVSVLAAGSGESCVAAAPDQTIGNDAIFSCSMVFATLGNRQLTASYTGSATFNDGDSTSIALAVVREANLSVTLGDAVAAVEPGAMVEYLIEIRNIGPDAAPGSLLVVAAEPALVNAQWQCVAVGAALCPEANGSGEIGLLLEVPTGAGFDFVQTGQAANPLASDLLVQASVVADPEAPHYVVDPDLLDNQASDSNQSLDPRIFGDDFE